jgi:hypothetical protein
MLDPRAPDCMVVGSSRSLIHLGRWAFPLSNVCEDVVVSNIMYTKHACIFLDEAYRCVAPCSHSLHSFRFHCSLHQTISKRLAPCPLPFSYFQLLLPSAVVLPCASRRENLYLGCCPGWWCPMLPARHHEIIRKSPPMHGNFGANRANKPKPHDHC